MTADYAARVRTLAARHNREWQLLVEDMDRERSASRNCCYWEQNGEHQPDCKRRLGHAEAEEHA